MDYVSIIIPIYNREKTIRASINSILMQTYETWELILVDDGSEDSSVDICREYVQRDNRIRLIECEHGGVSAARNRGIKEAKYDLIAFNDSDDLWIEEKLQKQLEKNDEDDYGLIYSRYLYDAGHKKHYVPSKGIPKSELEGFIYESIKKINKVGTPTMLVKKKVFDDVGLFMENLHSFEDWEFVLRVSHKYKIGFIDDSLVVADYKKGDGVNSNNYGKAETLIYIIEKHNLFRNNRMVKLLFEYLAKTSQNDRTQIYLKYKNIFDQISYSKELVDMMSRECICEREQKAFLINLINKSENNTILDKLNIMQDADICIYGAGFFGRGIANVLSLSGYKIKCIYDINVVYLEGYNVISPYEETKCLCDVLLNTTPYNVDFLYSSCNKIVNLYDFLDLR